MQKMDPSEFEQPPTTEQESAPLADACLPRSKKHARSPAQMEAFEKCRQKRQATIEARRQAREQDKVARKDERARIRELEKQRRLFEKEKERIDSYDHLLDDEDIHPPSRSRAAPPSFDVEDLVERLASKLGPRLHEKKSPPPVKQPQRPLPPPRPILRFV